MDVGSVVDILLENSIKLGTRPMMRTTWSQEDDDDGRNGTKYYVLFIAANPFLFAQDHKGFYVSYIQLHAQVSISLPRFPIRLSQ